MGAEAGSSLLMHVGLVGLGFVLGRVQLLPLLLQLLAELYALSLARKVLMVGTLATLVTIYVVGLLLPLRRIADQEVKRNDGVSPTSFRRELRRRGSYSMSYVTDIKAHVFAHT